MPPDSPPMGVVNFLGVTAIQNLANVSSSGITALQNVAVVNSSRINFPRVLLRLPGKSAGIFLLPPRVLPPPPPLPLPSWQRKGGREPGGRKICRQTPLRMALSVPHGLQRFRTWQTSVLQGLQHCKTWRLSIHFGLHNVSFLRDYSVLKHLRFLRN